MITMIAELKRFRWKVKGELFIWKMYLLRVIPGVIGISIRKKFLVKRFARYGENPCILEGFIVDNPSGLFIGDNFICNRNCHVNAGGTIRIGNNVMLGPGVKIWSVNHRFDDPSIPISKQGYEYAEVNIGDDVWVGSNVFISPGVTIGTRCIIGACTVLTKSVEPFSLVVGNPGKVIKTLQ
jgi:acetyltransferase-like isoleucine patch superfamily enzyme